MEDAERRLVLVVGPGRSGTSTIGGILACLGWHVPDQVDSDDTNPSGFFEPRWVVDLHTEQLDRADVATLDTDPHVLDHLARVVPHQDVGDRLFSWLEAQFSAHPRLLVKDPRLLWFFPQWLAAADRCGAGVSCVLMLRNPSEVVASRQAYYEVAPVTGSAGWVNAMMLTELITRGRSRVVVDYRRLLGDWRKVLEEVDSELDIGLADSDRSTLDAVERFVDPALQRMPPGWEGLHVLPTVADLADELYRTLAAESPDEADQRASLDGLRRRYIDVHDLAAGVVKHSVRRRVRLARRRRGARGE